MHAADILIDEHTLVLRLIEGDENAFVNFMLPIRIV